MSGERPGSVPPGLLDDDWEIWFGPEVGKILAPGRILYAKPGFGIDPDPNEREWSFEVGYRHFS